jgi:hypothetical protein
LRRTKYHAATPPSPRSSTCWAKLETLSFRLGLNSATARGHDWLLLTEVQGSHEIVRIDVVDVGASRSPARADKNGAEIVVRSSIRQAESRSLSSLAAPQQARAERLRGKRRAAEPWIRAGGSRDPDARLAREASAALDVDTRGHALDPRRAAGHRRPRMLPVERERPTERSKRKAALVNSRLPL